MSEVIIYQGADYVLSGPYVPPTGAPANLVGCTVTMDFKDECGNVQSGVVTIGVDNLQINVVLAKAKTAALTTGKIMTDLKFDWGFPVTFSNKAYITLTDTVTK
jgi:hypothetical protein